MKFGLFGGAVASKAAQDSGAAGFANVSIDSSSHVKFVDYVIEADRLGFHSVFVVEHHFTGTGQLSASLNLLAYLAGRTQKIRLGTAVIVVPWHNPVLLAEQAATLDVLSSGRLDFGVGKGYRDYEFKGFCIAPEEATARFEEGVAVVRKAWTNDSRFSHHGRYWHFDDVVVEPATAQRPHPPLWMAAVSDASIGRAAREGFNLLLDQLAPVEVIGARIQRFREECEKSGRIFDPMNVAVTRSIYITRNAADLSAAYEHRRGAYTRLGALAGGANAERYRNAYNLTDAQMAEDDSALIGKPHELVDQLLALEAVGAVNILLAQPSLSADFLKVFTLEVRDVLEAKLQSRPTRVPIHEAAK
jgi:alkanesulfonate monooxygenase SsuD/methylene tetrahydromethanopterin reductase-like flavin-dependent oxidoreductase (luciferase family)